MEKGVWLRRRGSKEYSPQFPCAISSDGGFGYSESLSPMVKNFAKQCTDKDIFSDILTLQTTRVVLVTHPFNSIQLLLRKRKFLDKCSTLCLCDIFCSY